MIYQLKVTLQDIRPQIWRRIHVHSGTSLELLHEILQITMGWENSHLYHFIINKEIYGSPNHIDNDLGPKTNDASRTFLAKVVPNKGFKFAYEYDFGDGWMHDIVVEKIIEEPKNKIVDLPVCISGKRACPPEDCGGPFGYKEFIQAYCDPHHENHADVFTWRGPGYDPNRFSVGEVNLKFEGRY